MSGGHFNYNQSVIEDIGRAVRRLIERHPDSLARYSDKTIAEFEQAVNVLAIARIYAHRIDWLVSGDDSEETFHEKLASELAMYRKPQNLNNNHRDV